MTYAQNPTLRIAICSDHAGYTLKEFLKLRLGEMLDTWQITDMGTHTTDSCDYPDFAHPCAEAVETGKADIAIAICGSGQGMAMTLNKHSLIRAALCWDTELAALARQHNDANTLVLPARFITPEKAAQIMQTFLDTPFEGGRHIRRVEKIKL